MVLSSPDSFAASSIPAALSVGRFSSITVETLVYIGFAVAPAACSAVGSTRPAQECADQTTTFYWGAGFQLPVYTRPVTLEPFPAVPK